MKFKLTIITLCLIFIFFSFIKITNCNISATKYRENQLLFSDDFSTTTLDNKWLIKTDFKSGRVGDFTSDNVQVDNGQLKLSTTFDDDGSIHSGYISTTKDDFDNNFNYGYYEARLKFTNNNHLQNGTNYITDELLKPWGAFWLYPTELNTSYATEVDITENQTVGLASASIHPMYNQTVLSNEDDIKIKNLELNTSPTSFHTYGIAIQPNQSENGATYQFFIDDKPIKTASSNIPLSLQTLHLTMEIATPDYQQLTHIDPEIASSLHDEAMYVDYIKVYSIK